MSHSVHITALRAARTGGYRCEDRGWGTGEDRGRPAGSGEGKDEEDYEEESAVTVAVLFWKVWREGESGRCAQGGSSVWGPK